MQTKLLKTLNEVLKALSANKKLAFKTSKLFSFLDSEITTPVGNIIPLLFHHKSELNDQFVSMDLLKSFINQLTHDKKIIRLNHVGFCYRVSSQEVEKKRLKKLMSGSEFHLYQEPSNDYGMWFFIGNTDNWEEEPMVELIPVERTDDKWVDYWLPHIQIDIDTDLTEGEIKKYVKLTFGESIKPFSITIEGIVYTVRNRLGVIDGVNIMLDLATNSRNVKYHRQNILERIV